MPRYFIERRFPGPVTEEELRAAALRAKMCVGQMQQEGIHIQWIRTMVTEDTLPTAFCHYGAQDEAALQEHARRALLPITKISLAFEIIPELL